ncbi:MAG TPA: F0F1 ATP synthase subunit B [Candidatus Saccharimonadales bacterium]|nr:F0F1 ATP synthase subunit B [Candidatus Saccharimonadales bacterium]
MDILTQFGASEAGSGDVLSALGIDWKILIFQIVAFLILVWFLGKYVYPVLMKTIDARQAEIEAGTKAASEAEKKAAKAEADVTKLMKQARKDATEIVSTAREEANAALEAADAKAKSRADAIVASAHDQIQKDVIAAKKTLHNETIDLVAAATEKVVGKTISAKVDDSIIANAVKEAK